MKKEYLKKYKNVNYLAKDLAKLGGFGFGGSLTATDYNILQTLPNNVPIFLHESGISYNAGDKVEKICTAHGVGILALQVMRSK